VNVDQGSFFTYGLFLVLIKEFFFLHCELLGKARHRCSSIDLGQAFPQQSKESNEQLPSKPDCPVDLTFPDFLDLKSAVGTVPIICLHDIKVLCNK